MANWPWFNIVTVVIALWGAGLSTYNYRAQRRRDQLALKVELKEEIDYEEGDLEPILSVCAANIAYRSIHLENVAIILKGGEVIVPRGHFSSDVDLPRELKEGKKFTAYIFVNSLTKILAAKGYNGRVKLRGRLVDEAGNVYRSRWHTYQMRTWEKPKSTFPWQ